MHSSVVHPNTPARPTGVLTPHMLRSSLPGLGNLRAGEKLSESTATDVRALCNTLLNCYLIQLLETGFLHADPHPGNLLRTPDGRICILDFGMMTSISADRSIALVEYISHLSVADWTGVARDLTKLGFTEPGKHMRSQPVPEARSAAAASMCVYLGRCAD